MPHIHWVTVPAVVEISVSLDDGVRFFSAWGGAKFMIHNPPVINRFKPTCGPNTGNTEIVLSGASIVDTGDYCVRFVCGTQERIVRCNFKVESPLTALTMFVGPSWAIKRCFYNEELLLELLLKHVCICHSHAAILGAR